MKRFSLRARKHFTTAVNICSMSVIIYFSLCLISFPSSVIGWLVVYLGVSLRGACWLPLTLNEIPFNDTHVIICKYSRWYREELLQYKT